MIYLLDNDSAKSAQYLDDLALDKMIKTVAQTLCNVHYLEAVYSPLKIGQTLSCLTKNIPLPLKNNDKGLSASHDSYSKWGKICRANYLQLVEMGLACCEEWQYRFSNSKITTTYKLKTGEKSEKVEYDFRHKYQAVAEWASDNTPHLPDNYKKDTVTIEINGIKQRVLSPTLKQEMTYFPITIPAKFWVVDDPFPICDLVASHRKYYQAKLLEAMDRKPLYEHSIFGKGFTLVNETKDGWCSLEQIFPDGSKCGVADNRNNLKVYNKPRTPTWGRRQKPEWLNLER